MLNSNDFNILRFKISKLLRTKEARIKSIDINNDDSVYVHTGFGFFPISFKSVNEINSEFKKYYPSTKIPNKYLVFNAKNNEIVDPVNTVKSFKKNKQGLPILNNNLGLRVLNK